MPTHTKAKTRRQWRHPASRSASHREDKRQGDLRRETDWIGVDAPQRPSPRRSFGPIEGHEYTCERGQWHRCETPEEFADYLEYEARRRNWYRDQTSRKGVPVTMTRRVSAPLEILTTTFSPWLSDWTADAVTAGRDPRPRLAEVRNGWLQAAQTLVGENRFLLGYAFHADTDDLHFDIVLSRQDGNGGRIGKTALKTVGPWCVGMDRQVRAGAEIHSDKRRQLRRGIACFRRRYGETAVPLDVALSRALDSAADESSGMSYGRTAKPTRNACRSWSGSIPRPSSRWWRPRNRSSWSGPRSRSRGNAHISQSSDPLGRCRNPNFRPSETEGHNPNKP